MHELLIVKHHNQILTIPTRHIFRPPKKIVEDGSGLTQNGGTRELGDVKNRLLWCMCVHRWPVCG
jgi:hypothetical protein